MRSIPMYRFVIRDNRKPAAITPSVHPPREGGGIQAVRTGCGSGSPFARGGLRRYGDAVARLLLAFVLVSSAFAVDEPVALTGPLVPFNMCMDGETPAWQTSLCSSLGYTGIVVSNIDPTSLASFATATEVQSGRVRVVAAMNWWNVKNAISVSSLDSSLDQLAKLGAALWMVTDGDSGRTTASIAAAVPGLRIVADRCKAKGVQMVLYPHGGAVVDNIAHAAEMVTSIGRPEVKLSLVLCHELNDAKQQGKTIEETDVILKNTITTLSTQIALVCIAGADKVVNISDWSTTIKPLDQGTYDLRPAVLRTLASKGYTGPMILHTYGLTEAPAVHLPRSLATWNSWIVPVTTPAPTITAVSPATGPATGGTTVTITGTNLTGTSSVLFGSMPSASVTVVNATTVSCVAPVRNSAGAVGVVLTTVGGPAARVGAYTYTASAPTITGLSTTTGPAAGGTTVTITGTNLSGTSMVTFGGTLATSVVAASATSVTCVTPARSAGTVAVVLTAPGGAVTKASAFTYVAAPTITSLSVVSGPVVGGTLVTITGTNLTGTSAVSIGGVAATSVTVVSATSVTCVTPAHAAGVVSVILTTPGGSVTKASAFTFVASSVPTITSLSVASGPTTGGTAVTITGTNLTGTSAVSFGGTAATSVTVVGATSVTCVAPAHAAGAVDVVLTAPGGTATKVGSFTYVAPQPTITGLSPAIRTTAGGTLVTITGTNLSGTSSVVFGGTAATSVTVVSATSVTCITPAHAAGTVDVVLTTSDGQVTAVGAFTYVVVPTGTGTIARQIWSGAPGRTVAEIPLATPPTTSDTLGRLETPERTGDSYGTRIRGYLTAPYTGSYVFWIAGDDTCSLRLGTGEAPASKVQIASVPYSTGVRVWTAYAAQKSAAIVLTAGQRYFIEVLHKENLGNDHVSVGWTLPGEATTAPSSVVPGTQLSPYLPAPAPSGVTATALSGGKAVVAWTDNAGTETGFRIERRNGVDGIYAVVATAAADTTTFQDSGLVAGTQYGYRVGAVGDDGDITYGAEASVTIPSALPVGSGSISRDIWNDVAGSLVSNIPLGTIPSVSDTLASLEETASGKDAFATRVRGYITAPYTGTYTFWLSGDDSCALWLSTDEQVARKVKIASFSGATASRQWNAYATQKSVAIALVAGNRYYVEVLHKEGSGGDHMAVGWAKPGEATTAPSEVVPGSQLSPFAGDSLPSPWLTRDIGAVGVTGCATALDEVWSVAGSGNDIWGTADAFRFAYLAVTGDFSCTARVTAMPNTNPWAKAGIMARETLDANAVYAMMAMTPGYGVRLQYRSVAGGTSGNNANIVKTVPYWVRLVRSGNVWTGFASPDGLVWTQAGAAQTIVMGSTIQLGLAVASHDNTLLNATGFDNVVITPAGNN